MTRLKVILVTAASLLLLGCGASEDMRDSINVRFSEPKIDAGRIPPTTIVKARWELVNESQCDVSINKLVLSCSCMNTDFEPTVLGPRERQVFNTWVNDPHDGMAAYTGRVVVVGQRQPIEFNWNYEIWPEATLDPSVIQLGTIWLIEGLSIEDREITVQDILVPRALEEPLAPEKIERMTVEAGEYSVLDYEIEPLDSELVEGARFKLKLAPKSNKPSGTFADKIVIKVELKERFLALRLLVTGGIYKE